MTSPRLALCLRPFLVAFAAMAAMGAEESPFTRLFDTGLASAEPLAEASLAQRTGWQLVAEDTLEHTFAGDAVLLNDKLAVVLRRQGRAAEVWSKAAKGWVYRASAGPSAVRSPLGRLKILENTASVVMVEARFPGEPPAAVRFRLTTGEAILETRPEETAGFLRVQCQARHVVVPDYFGDDVVFGAGGPTEECLPAENFCLSLIEGGEAILMSVWQSREQEVWLSPAGASQEPAVSANRMRCLKGKSIWLAFLESPGLWRAGDVSAADDWKPPFPAKWRCSLVEGIGVANSWDLEQGPAADPTDRPQKGTLLRYPMDRSTATPLTVTCPTDVMRNTLGVGPCQYILACEGLAADGDPTPNSVMLWIEKRFEQKKERKVADEIKERLDFMQRHVAEARGRIERYREFSGQLRSRLEPKPGATVFGPILDDLDRAVAGGLAPAASPERAGQLSGEVIALIGKENSAAACHQLGDQLRAVGAAQDRALARCRMSVRRIQAQARSLAVNQPSASLSPEALKLVDQMLQNKAASSGQTSRH